METLFLRGALSEMVFSTPEGERRNGVLFVRVWRIGCLRLPQSVFPWTEMDFGQPRGLNQSTCLSRCSVVSLACGARGILSPLDMEAFLPVGESTDLSLSPLPLRLSVSP